MLLRSPTMVGRYHNGTLSNQRGMQLRLRDVVPQRKDSRVQPRACNSVQVMEQVPHSHAWHSMLHIMAVECGVLQAVTPLAVLMLACAISRLHQYSIENATMGSMAAQNHSELGELPCSERRKSPTRSPAARTRPLMMNSAQPETSTCIYSQEWPCS